MKSKVIVVVLLCVMGLVTMGIGNSEAAGAGWYTCIPNSTGVNGSTTFIQLTDTAATPAFTNLWFVIQTANAMDKQMLAVALTAFANSTNVWVYLTDSTEYSTIAACFAKK